MTESERSCSNFTILDNTKNQNKLRVHCKYYSKEDYINVEIDNNDINITIQIANEKTLATNSYRDNIEIPGIFLQDFRNTSGRRGYGHLVLCHLLRNLVERNIIKSTDEIGWEAITVPHIKQLVHYYESIGGSIIDTDIERAYQENHVLMKSTVSNLLNICQELHNLGY